MEAAFTSSCSHGQPAPRLVHTAGVVWFAPSQGCTPLLCVWGPDALCIYQLEAPGLLRPRTAVRAQVQSVVAVCAPVFPSFPLKARVRPLGPFRKP